MEKYLPRIKPALIIERVNLKYSLEELFPYFKDCLNTSILFSSPRKGIGRYSFMGIEPFMVLSSKNKNIELKFNKHKISVVGDPFAYLDSILKTYQINNQTSLPFIGGAIGYFSYDLKNLLERLPQKAKDDLNLPDMYFVFYRTLLIHDNLNPNHLYISILDIASTKYKGAKGLMKEIKRIVKSSPKKWFSPLGHKSYKPIFKTNFSKIEYIRAVRKAIDYIYAGDIFQVNLSQRFETKWPYSPYELYFRLNKMNPAPFSAYLNFEKFKIISSSPELFLKISEGIVETRPMKGTRPRGMTPEEDKRLKDELRKSEKDGSELSMIVDLERNDLGKICRPGSVVVTKHKRIENYSTVFQTISIIKGRVDKGISLIDIVKATFPGGSITGCPKIRAMEIIDELEPTTRNVYTGALGYISFHDTMELSIVIRTMAMKGHNIYLQVGGGVVADSNPEAEYQETLDKAYALRKTLAIP